MSRVGTSGEFLSRSATRSPLQGLKPGALGCDLTAVSALSKFAAQTGLSAMGVVESEHGDLSGNSSSTSVLLMFQGPGCLDRVSPRAGPIPQPGCTQPAHTV